MTFLQVLPRLLGGPVSPEMAEAQFAGSTGQLPKDVLPRHAFGMPMALCSRSKPLKDSPQTRSSDIFRPECVLIQPEFCSPTKTSAPPALHFFPIF